MNTSYPSYLSIPRTCIAIAGLIVACTFANSCGAEEQATVCRYCEHAKHLQQAGASSGGSLHYAPDRQVDVTHIKLDVTPDFDQEDVQVVARLSFAPLRKPLKSLRLDGIDLEVTEVVGSQAVADFDASAEHVTIIFDEPIELGQDAWVEITYSAQPTKGLYFRTPKMGYPETDTHLWTQGEPHEARHWFPCFDYPNERSSSEIICHVPKSMTVLSNGKLIDESIDGKTKTVHWKQEKPHANYLICLVAGHFEKLEKSHRDVPLAFFSQPSIAAHAKNSFRDTPDIMAFFEQEIGVPFPWDKYYQVTIRDFMWGGMENTSLTTLTHKTIFSDETENIHSSRGLDAHEMAHQWFGDYVTCKDWSHLWLNEGFATFYTHLFKGHASGKDEMLYGLYKDARGRILTQAKDTRPIVYKEYASAGEQFDYRSYPKGSWVLHMLRSQLGPELYRKCIKTYLERHALSPVTTSDLSRVIEEVSGQSFDRFFDQWVYRPRFPDIAVTYSWDEKKKQIHVAVKQTHETNKNVKLFEFPTTLRFHVGGEIVDHDIEVNERQHDFYFSLDDEPEIVRFDPHYTLLGQINVAQSSRGGKPIEMLAAQLRNDDDVMGRLLAVAELSGQPGRKKKAKAAKLLGTVLKNDRFWGVRVEAAKALRKLGNDASYAALTDNLDQSNAKVRYAVVSALGKTYRPETLVKLKKLYADESNPAIRSSIVKAMGKFDIKETQPVVKQALASDTFREEELSAGIAALRAQNNPALRGALQKALADRGDDMGAYAFGKGLSALAQLTRTARGSKKKNAGRKRATREFIESYLDHPKSIVKMSAITALGELGDSTAASVLESFSDDRDDRIAKVADEALKKLREEKPFVPSEIAELRKTIAELKDDYDELREEFDQLKLSATEAFRAAKQHEPASESAAPEDGDEPSDTANELASADESKESTADNPSDGS